MKKDKWIKRWPVRNSKNTGNWIVAIDADGNYGCSCPVWKFKRQECKHIRFIKEHPELKSDTPTQIKHPDLIPANVLRPEFDKDKNVIHYPLVAFGGSVWMEVTICWFLMEHGFSWGEVKQARRHIPNSWTKSAVYAHIEENGLAEYTNYPNEGPQKMKRQTD